MIVSECMCVRARVCELRDICYLNKSCGGDVHSWAARMCLCVSPRVCRLDDALVSDMGMEGGVMLAGGWATEAEVLPPFFTKTHTHM